VPGDNVIAVEVHQANVKSSDLIFDLELLSGGTGSGDPGTALVRGPYLQMGTTSSAIIRWRTSGVVPGRVWYGTDPAALTQTVDGPATAEHVIKVTGLFPDTQYHYAIGTLTGTLAGADADHYFVTAPLPGTGKPTRVWVLGDSGTADANARAVRDAYRTHTGTRATDLILMLGDNAYPNGTDAEYQKAVYEMYPTFLRNTFLWPTIGNHDSANLVDVSKAAPYLNMFSLPTAGEAGGVASGTEQYYSFDYGEIHFVSLDSMLSSRAQNGAMLTWLKNDLEQNSKPWLVAFFHHPPYSKGSHNSDTEKQLVEMRQNALPILESYGVDLVLTGHSHSYERSYLLDGHYGASSTLTTAMKKSTGDGREGSDGVYQKETFGPGIHQGAVYVVTGSAGKISGGSLNHPAMLVGLNELGSFIIDVEGNRLDAKFLRSDGAVRDYFTMVKGEDTPPPPPADFCVGKADNTPCDDGLFCNGTEACIAQRCVTVAPRLCDDGNLCTTGVCNEATQACEQIPAMDMEGQACGGDSLCSLKICQVGTCAPDPKRDGACQVSPKVTCILPEADGYTAVFGYTNSSSENVRIARGVPSNHLETEDATKYPDVGQPEWFKAGGETVAFTFKSDGQAVWWTLQGAVGAEATITSPPCNSLFEVISTSEGTALRDGQTTHVLSVDAEKVLNGKVLATEVSTVSPTWGSLAAGGTQGEFSVTNDGAATYRLPIAVPPGRAGIQPEIAFTYNSRRGNGPLGVGWDISGFPEISVCIKNPRDEGGAAPIRYDDQDALCFEGQRLIPVQGLTPPGPPGGREYRTERDTGARIVAREIQANGVPKWFEVYLRNGQIMRFGVHDRYPFQMANLGRPKRFAIGEGRTPVPPENQERVQFMWPLTEVADRFENTMTVDYDVIETGTAYEHLPTSITYTGRGATLGLRSVRFVYEPKANNFDRIQRFVAGVERIERPYGQSTFEYDNFGRLRFERRTDDTPTPGAVAVRETRYEEYFTTRVFNEVGHENYITTDGLGQMVEKGEIVDGRTIKTLYDYLPFGLLWKVHHGPDGNRSTTSMGYDALGRRTSLTTPDTGTTTTWYNAFGEIRQEKDAEDRVSVFAYDALGRLVRRTDNDVLSTAFKFDGAPHGIGAMSSATRPTDGVLSVFAYDQDFGALRATDLYVPSGTQSERFASSQSFDRFRRVETVTYPETGSVGAHFTVRHVYGTNGDLKEVRNATPGAGDALFWAADQRDVLGQIKKERPGNGVLSQRVYFPETGRLKSIVTTGSAVHQNLAYTYREDGSVQSRSDLMRGIHEGFGYDGLDRLTSWYQADACRRRWNGLRPINRLRWPAGLPASCGSARDGGAACWRHHRRYSTVVRRVGAAWKRALSRPARVTRLAR
jgi:YD repeat-containing protein